jgi:hypothetical protein
MANKSKGKALSVASPYEQLFRTRYRSVGRPSGDAEPLFAAPDADPDIAAVAKRRAYAVVHEEQRERLSELFERELRVLNRRGKDEVMADVGRRVRSTDSGEEN